MRLGILNMVVFVLTACFSCTGSRDKEQVVLLTRDRVIDQLSDSTFFTAIDCLMACDGDIYATLRGRMQIARLDRDLNLKNMIGKQGRGPGEFNLIRQFSISKDTLRVENEGVGMMKFTLEGEFIGMEEKMEGYSAVFNRYTVEDGTIYFSDPDPEKRLSLEKLDLRSDEENSLTRFGNFMDFGARKKNIGQNGRHVFVADEYILAVPAGIPVIEKYDRKSLELIESFDLATYPAIAEAYRIAASYPSSENPDVSQLLVNDVYLKDDLLYLCHAGRIAGENGEMEPLGIMVYDVSKSTRYLKRYPVEMFLSQICVTDDYIYAAPVTGGEIERYVLDK